MGTTVCVLRTRAVLGAALLLGCSEPTAPERPLDAAPAITQLAVLPGIRRHGALRVSAHPTDSAFRLPKGSFVAAVVTTSRGDSETVALYRLLCGHRVACRRIIVWMEEGYLAGDIEPAIRGPDARMPHYGVRAGSVWAFGDRHKVLNRVASLPGVSSAGFDLLIASDSDADFSHYLAGALPFAHGAIVPGDGELTVEDGDVVEVAYEDEFGVRTVVSVNVGTLPP